MNQSKRLSLIESLTQTVAGFVVSMLVWEFVVKPLWNIQTGLLDNFLITLMFATVSIVRGYLFRRAFNRLHRA